MTISGLARHPWLGRRRTRFVLTYRIFNIVLPVRLSRQTLGLFAGLGYMQAVRRGLQPMAQPSCGDTFLPRKRGRRLLFMRSWPICALLLAQAMGGGYTTTYSWTAGYYTSTFRWQRWRSPVVYRLVESTVLEARLGKAALRFDFTDFSPTVA